MSAATVYRPLRHLHGWLRVGRAGIVAIVVLSLVPMPHAVVPVEHADKLEHVLTYFALSAWYAQLIADRRRLALYGLAFVVLGFALELAQGLTPWRENDWQDLVADAIGVALGYAVAFTPLRNVLHRLEALPRAAPP